MTDDYKPFSISAVAAVIFLLLAGTSVLTPLGLWFAVPAIIFAVASVLHARRYPTSGSRLAVISLTAAMLLLAVVPACYYFRFKSEAPDGYQRLSFADAVEDESFDRHVGSQICLKGFPLLQGWSGTPAGRMILSHDGGFRQTERAVAVQMKSRSGQTLGFQPLAVSGTLIRNPSPGPGSPQYILIDAVVRKSLTPFDIAPPANEAC